MVMYQVVVRLAAPRLTLSVQMPPLLVVRSLSLLSLNCSHYDHAPAGCQVHVVVVIVHTMIMILLVVRSLSLLSLFSL